MNNFFFKWVPNCKASTDISGTKGPPPSEIKIWTSVQENKPFKSKNTENRTTDIT